MIYSLIATFRGSCKLGLVLVFATLVTSCVTAHSGPESAMYIIDVQITSDPSGAEIFSIPSKSHSGEGRELKDYGYNKYGFGQQWIGRTPYRGRIVIHAEARNELVHTVWQTQTEDGGDIITMAKVAVQKQDKFFYYDFHHTFMLGYLLKHESAGEEPFMFSIAEGTYGFMDMLKEASSVPVVKHHVLRQKQQ